MRGPLILAAGVALLLPQLGAQALSPQEPRSPIIKHAPQSVLKALHVKAGLLQELSVPASLPASFRVRAMVGHDYHTLVLHAHDIRSAGFQLLESSANGIRRLETPPSTTYRGHLAGVEDSVVAASLINGQLNAFIMIGDEVYGIQPASDLVKTYAKNVHVSFMNKDLLPMPGISCGTTGTRIAPIAGKNGGVTPAALKLAEVGIDADYDFYLKKGSSTTNVQNSVNQVMNAVDAIYKRDVTITYKITTIIVRTSRVYSGSIQSRLGQFRNRWNGFHGNVQRDMAHLFTGQGSFSGVIGVAYLGVVCNLGAAYGTSKAFHSSNGVNAGLVAHEMGHNWNAGHCNSCGSDCKIMCSGLGGCGRNIGAFGNCAKGAIVSFKNSRGCLSNPGPPQLTQISPSQVGALGGTVVQLTGSSLSGISEVNIGAVKAAKFSVISDTRVTFEAPTPTALGAQLVTVRNSNGLSNSVSLTYVATNPPVLQAPGIAFVNFQMEFKFGAKPGAIALMLWNADGRTFQIFGSTVVTPLIVLPIGALNSVGVGSLKFTPSTALKGLRLWSQVGTFNGLSWGGASNILSTLFF